MIPDFFWSSLALVLLELAWKYARTHQSDNISVSHKAKLVFKISFETKFCTILLYEEWCIKNTKNFHFGINVSSESTLKTFGKVVGWTYKKADAGVIFLTTYAPAYSY